MEYWNGGVMEKRQNVNRDLSNEKGLSVVFPIFQYSIFPTFHFS